MQLSNILQAQHVIFHVHVESEYTLHAKALSLVELSVLRHSYSMYAQKTGELSAEHRSDLCTIISEVLDAQLFRLLKSKKMLLLSKHRKSQDFHEK